jgi:hypothetical protein
MTGHRHPDEESLAGTSHRAMSSMTGTSRLIGVLN